MILRLQTLIASGEISADDVAVYCLEEGENGPVVERMEFDERGVPQRGWPKDFLDTDLILARELAQARKDRKN